LGEGDTERVDPEVVGQLGVAGRDVAGYPFVEAKLAEDPERRRKALLAMEAFLVDIGKARVLKGGKIGGPQGLRRELDGHGGSRGEEGRPYIRPVFPLNPLDLWI
jgi:hypothetical protein